MFVHLREALVLISGVKFFLLFLSSNLSYVKDCEQTPYRLKQHFNFYYDYK